MESRLAAILAADVVGYSRMMEKDEAGTLAALTCLVNEFINPLIAEHKGRIVKLIGDGILAEFVSVLDAVACAIAWQGKMKDRKNALECRIGINLGEIIFQDNDIFGNGVNVAARLEAAAPPGGVCISSIVFEQIAGKINVDFVDGGIESFKNIDKPIHVLRWHPGRTLETTYKRMVIPSTPDKPSIAVLPFANLSNDPEQEYFADGIAEDIITALSHIDHWFVVARNSSFVYKGRHVDVREIAKALGVRYVLEGSVRKAGSQLRITGQLIETETGTHLWAGKYDGGLDDVFALQDKITESVVGAIEPSLRKAEIERSKRKRPENVGAYDLYLRSLPYLYAARPAENELALALLHKAIELDPGYAPALAYLAWGYEARITRNWGAYSEDDAGMAIALAHSAIKADRNDAVVMALAGFVLVMISRDYDLGLQLAGRARELNPNIAFVSWIVGASLFMSGMPEEGVVCFESSIRVSPGDPGVFFSYTGAAMCHLLCGRAAEAYDYASKSARIYPDWDTTYRVLAAALFQLGRIDESRVAIAKLLELAPTLTVSGLRERWPIRDKESLNRILDSLQAAGLPE